MYAFQRYIDLVKSQAERQLRRIAIVTVSELEDPWLCTDLAFDSMSSLRAAGVRAFCMATMDVHAVPEPNGSTCIIEEDGSPNGEPDDVFIRTVHIDWTVDYRLFYSTPIEQGVTTRVYFHHHRPNSSAVTFEALEKMRHIESWLGMNEASFGPPSSDSSTADSRCVRREILLEIYGLSPTSVDDGDRESASIRWAVETIEAKFGKAMGERIRFIYRDRAPSCPSCSRGL